MKDTIAVGTFAGTIGIAILDLSTFISRMAGIRTSTPWDVATLVFLNPRYLGTVSGYIVGLSGSLAMGIAIGIITALVIRISGHDYALLKGVLVAEAIGFVTLGFFAPLLGIAAFLKNEPATNIFALVNLFIFGLVVGFVIKRYGVFTRAQDDL